MIVVDSSALVDVLVMAPESAELRVALAVEDLQAPALIDVEVVSALRGLTLGGHLSPGRAQEALLDYDDLTIHRWQADAPLRHRAFGLRENVSAYDAVYVALAEALQCPLITRDARLARSSGHEAEIRVY